MTRTFFASALRLILVVAPAAVAAFLNPSPQSGRGEFAADDGGLARILKVLHQNGPSWTRDGLTWLAEREATYRFITILTGKRVNAPGAFSVWSKPGASRYSFAWLSQRFDADRDGVIVVHEFAGSREWFDLLDRDRDSKLTALDFDWSKSAGYAKGKESAAKGKEKGGGGGPNPLMLSLFFTGDVGSLHEGPKVNQRAPDFTLKSMDGKKSFTLAENLGKKPTVIIFGSFT
ncbi:MAG: hypothetical protein L0Y72_02505 [Gemmataceae bacterium]|nr:hypothetical protein [Gemmataceae bacterium]MCI0737888.1 hypothetical protein [Gemmataceae bacterium]